MKLTTKSMSFLGAPGTVDPRGPDRDDQNPEAQLYGHAASVRSKIDYRRDNRGVKP